MSSSVFATVISGVIVFVTGQIIVKSTIEPYVAFKEQMGMVSALLLRNQAKITNNNPNPDLIYELKDAAALLLAKYSAMPHYVKTSILGWRLLPSHSHVLNAAQHLNLISSALAGNERINSYVCIKEIGTSLGVPTTYAS